MERRNFLGLGSVACLLPIAGIASAGEKKEEIKEKPLRDDKPSYVNLHSRNVIEEDHDPIQTEFHDITIEYNHGKIRHVRDVKDVKWEDNPERLEQCELYNDHIVMWGHSISRDKGEPYNRLFKVTVWFKENLV
jgi:hypothetical protein